MIKKQRSLACINFLLLLFLFAGCQKDRTFSGEVLSQPENALIIQTDNGLQGFLITDDTAFLSLIEGVTREDILSGRLQGMVVSVTGSGAKTLLPTTAYGDLSALKAQTVTVTDILFQNELTLSDGTGVDIWRGAFGNSYRLEDRTELFFDFTCDGPYGQASESFAFAELPEISRVRILAYYEQLGRLYDVQTELERAYASYQKSSSDFTPFTTGQEILPAASGSSTVFFVARGWVSRSGGEGEETVIGSAFDRTTGKYLSYRELFTVDEESIKNSLLDLAGISSKEERARLLPQIHEGSLVFLPEGLELWGRGSEIWSVPYSSALSSIMEPGAIPQNNMDIP